MIDDCPAARAEGPEFSVNPFLALLYHKGRGMERAVAPNVLIGLRNNYAG
jgi:hypothetical protein